MSEQPDRTQILKRVADMLLALTYPHPLRVAIDGITAAGKTTLADELKPILELSGRQVIRASVDDFGRPRSERYRRGRESPEGYYHDAFNYPAVRRLLLKPLGLGGSRRYRIASFDSFNDVPLQTPELEAPPDAILLADGVFLFRPELNDLWDFRVFLDADLATAVQRGIVRDTASSHEPAEGLARRYERRYIPGEQMYIREVRPQLLADIVIDNTNPAHPRFQEGGNLP
jgi:uridine kinase